MASILDLRICLEKDGWALYDPSTKQHIERGLDENGLIDLYGKTFERVARESVRIAIEKAKKQYLKDTN